MVVMRNEREDLVAIGPVSIEYQAAMIRDELEESAGWTTAGIATVLTEKQAHDRCRDGRLTGGKPVARCLAACQPGSPHPCRRRSRLADAR
jgi:hypothetical protein